jgi:hypothetical protein
MEKFFDGFEV